MNIWVLREKNSGIVSFVEYPLHSNFKLYSALILVAFILVCYYSPKVNMWKQIFPEFLGAPRKNEFYCFFRGAPCIAILKSVVSWFQFFYCDFPIFIQNVSVKIISSWNFRCSPKGAVILLLLRSTLYIAVWKGIMSLIYFFLFCFCHVLPKTLRGCCIFPGTPCMWQFQFV